MSENKEIVSVNAIVKADLKKVWDCWTSPECIKQWNQASEDWHTTDAQNDLKDGGKFSSRMEAKDGSMGFDFSGRYDVVAPGSHLEYTLKDNRKVKINFLEKRNGIHVLETFEAESSQPVDIQKEGWQAILNSFKRFVEGLDGEG